MRIELRKKEKKRNIIGDKKIVNRFVICKILPNMDGVMELRILDWSRIEKEYQRWTQHDLGMNSTCTVAGWRNVRWAKADDPLKIK